MKKFIDLIPRVLSSTPAIFIFLFLFIYLVIFGLIGIFAKNLAPSADMQLVLGHYTNVTSALGAAIAAGAAATTEADGRERRDAPRARSVGAYGHPADDPPGQRGRCEQNRHEDAPAVAGADPGRHFWRKNRKRPAESAGEAQAGRGWHLRPCQLAGNFWGQQVSVT